MRGAQSSRVVGEEQRSTGVDEEALDWTANVSSPGRALRKPTSAFEPSRTPRHCHRAALCTRRCSRENSASYQEKMDGGVVTGNGDLQNKQRGRPTKQLSTSGTAEEEPVDMKRRSTNGLYRSALDIGGQNENSIDESYPSGTDGLEIGPSPQFSRVRSWVIFTAWVLMTGVWNQFGFTVIPYRCQLRRTQGRRGAVTGRGVVDSEAVIGRFKA